MEPYTILKCIAQVAAFTIGLGFITSILERMGLNTYGMWNWIFNKTSKKPFKKKKKVKEEVQIKFGKKRNEEVDNVKPIEARKWNTSSISDVGNSEILKRRSIFQGYHNAYSAKNPKATRWRADNVDIQKKDYFDASSLKLNLDDGTYIVYNLDTGKFHVDGYEYGAEIKNVKGLEYLGKSRIDALHIIKLKLYREDPLLLKINQSEKRFIVIKNHDEYMRPQPSNINEWWTNPETRTSHGKPNINDAGQKPKNPRKSNRKSSQSMRIKKFKEWL